MANTEILRVIRAVRVAEGLVNQELDQRGNAHDPEYLLLQQVLDYLRDLDTFLVFQDVATCLADLQDKAHGLQALNNQTNTELAHLAQLADAINTASRMVSALAGIFGFVQGMG